MELNQIKAVECPYCGAGIRAERRDNKHVNDLWNEYREFDCGYTLHFSPNFCHIEVIKDCPKSRVQKRFKEKRKIARNKLERYITRLDVDKEFKCNLIREVTYL